MGGVVGTFLAPRGRYGGAVCLTDGGLLTLGDVVCAVDIMSSRSFDRARDSDEDRPSDGSERYYSN